MTAYMYIWFFHMHGNLVIHKQVSNSAICQSRSNIFDKHFSYTSFQYSTKKLQYKRIMYFLNFN